LAELKRIGFQPAKLVRDVPKNASLPALMVARSPARDGLFEKKTAFLENNGGIDP